MPEELDADGDADGTLPKKGIDEHLKVVTAETLSRYTINDVVMPIVGYKTRMPENEELTKLILEIMAEDKITPEVFDRHILLDSTSAWGSYRKIVAFASDIEYDVVEFQNLNEDLLTPSYRTEPDPKPTVDADAGKPIYKALRLKFSLR
jgi:tRNA(Glu) U13 pseudouridine synthase TruD